MGVFKTLIVEDNPTFRQTLKDILGSQFPSMIIEEAGDSKTALKKSDALLPNLVFMDIKLPGENGLELTKKIKAKHPGIIVIILTGYGMPEYREAAQKHGADHFLMKDSSTNEEIVSLVQSILSDSGFNGGEKKN